MNYCTNCGAKLEKNNRFCTGCGAKMLTEKEIKEKDSRKIQNLLLILGVFLVLFSTFALGIISWQDMSNVLRLSFFAFEAVLFLGLSFVLKNLTKNNFYRVFFTIGLILIPYTLSLIPYYGLLTDYFNSGPGLYIYLAIIYFLTFVVYSIINISYKSQFINFISLLCLLVSFIFTALIFNDSFVLIMALITFYMFVINILSHIKLFSENYRKIMKIFVASLLWALPVFLLASFSNYDILSDKIINGASLLLYFLTGYSKIYKNDKTVFNGMLPFVYILLSTVYVSYLFEYNNIAGFYAVSAIALVQYFITLFFKSKVFTNITLGLTYFVQFILILSALLGEYNIVLIVLSVVTLLFSTFNIIVSKRYWINFLIPINIFVILIAASRLTFDLSMIYILLITCLLFLIMYVFMKLIKNKYALTYLVTTYGLAMISMYHFYYGYNLINYGIILVIFFIFIFSYIFKENTVISVVSFISLNISSLLLFIDVENTIYYGLLTISGLTLIFSMVLSYLKKVDLKPYIIYSQIVIFIITLTNHMHYSSYILFINVFLYALSYMSIIKFNNNKVWRIFYIMLGLLTCIRVVDTLIEPVVISSIISMLIVLIIITIMYLLEIEDNLSLGLISLIILYPYYALISGAFADISELYILPGIIYTVVFTEIIKFKNEENRKIWTIIPISILCYIFMISGEGVSSIIIDVILSLFLIFLGLYRKYNYFIYFGIIFIVVTIFIRIFTVLNSIAVVIVLIVIGFILIGAALFNELRKKK